MTVTSTDSVHALGVAPRPMDYRGATPSDVQVTVARDGNALAVVSHDLRNPLATIAMSATLMLDTMPDIAPNAPHRQAATKIVRVAEQMSGLLNDLLEVSRLEAGQLPLDCSPQPPEVLIGQALVHLHHTGHPPGRTRAQAVVRHRPRMRRCGFLRGCIPGPPMSLG